MARIRSIKPEFWEDEKLSKITVHARLMFIGMWNFSDDYGIVRGSASYIRSKVFIYDNFTPSQIKKWLSELESISAIIPFTWKSESFYIIQNFNKHQVINNRSKVRTVPEGVIKGVLDEYYSNNTTALQQHYGSTTVVIPQDYGAERKGKEGKGKEGKGGERRGKEVAAAASSPPSPDLLFEIYQQENKKLPDVKALTPERRQKLNARIKALNGRAKTFAEDFRQAVRLCQHTPFLYGVNDRKWKASFDWLIANNTNYVKVLEGKYNNESIEVF